MEMKRLNNGVEMPMLGFGTFQVTDLEICRRSVLEAIRAGYRLIDTAQIYGNEEAVGDAIRDAIAEGLVRREDLFIITKVWFRSFETEDCRNSLEVSMQKLGLDYIADDNTVPNWTDQKFIDWLNWWKEAEDSGYFMLKDPEGYHSGPYGNQQYFCYMGSSAGMNYITPNGFTIVTGPVPQVEGGKQYTEITTRAMVGFAKENEAENAGAAEFVKFFTNAENNLPFCQKYSASTPFSDVASSDVYKDYFNSSVAQQAFSILLPVSGTRKSVKGSGSADEALKAAVGSIIIDGADPAETMAAAQATANAALAD